MSQPYSIEPRHADLLAAALVLPADARRDMLVENLGAESLKELGLILLLSEFVGLARSVEENSREHIEYLLCAHGGYHPDSKERPNNPTLQGALAGVKIARTPLANMCSTCAYRLGTIPNQCLPTVADTTYALENTVQFMCHDALDEDDEPASLCVGFAAARAEYEKKAGAR
jgi:hypothetical protein